MTEAENIDRVITALLNVPEKKLLKKHKDNPEALQFIRDMLEI